MTVTVERKTLFRDRCGAAIGAGRRYVRWQRAMSARNSARCGWRKKCSRSVAQVVTCREGAFTLLEVLLVLTIVGILLAVAIPRSEPATIEQLNAAARIAAGELQLARSLAVANNSSYRVEFDVARNRMVLRHSGTNTALNILPRSPFQSDAEPPTSRSLVFSELPNVSAAVRLIGAVTQGSSVLAVDFVEFGPLGQTTAAAPTIVYLGIMTADRPRYIAISVQPITGLTSVGSITGGPIPPVLSVSKL